MTSVTDSTTTIAPEKVEILPPKEQVKGQSVPRKEDRRLVEGEGVFVDDIATVAQTSDTVVLSLPDGAVSEVVVAEIIATTDRTVRLVVDTSTVGLEASPRVARMLAEAPERR